MTHNKQNDKASRRTASNANFRTSPNQGRKPDADGHAQWQRRYEHYRNLALQAGNADPVTREQYWQHAEHFCRLMNGSAIKA